MHMHSQNTSEVLHCQTRRVGLSCKNGKLFPRGISEINTQCITKSEMDSEEEVITASVSMLKLVDGIKFPR